jgi:hypothetical protein
LNANEHLMRLEARVSKTFRMGHAWQAEGFYLAHAKNQIAGRVPRLARLHFDVDGIEAIKGNALLLAAAERLFDDDPTIGQPIPPA